jgi:hypothetical protein
MVDNALIEAKGHADRQTVPLCGGCISKVGGGKAGKGAQKRTLHLRLLALKPGRVRSTHLNLSISLTATLDGRCALKAVASLRMPQSDNSAQRCLGKHASLTLEHLHGRFQDALATNDDDEPYARVGRRCKKFVKSELKVLVPNLRLRQNNLLRNAEGGAHVSS